MNFPSIIVALVIAVLAILAACYSFKNGSSCKNCSGNCGACGHGCGTTEKTNYQMAAAERSAAALSIPVLYGK